MATITLTLEVADDFAYGDATHLVLVHEERPAFWAKGKTRYSVTVLKRDERRSAAVFTEVEEVGEGPLTECLTDAARVIRTGTAVKGA